MEDEDEFGDLYDDVAVDSSSAITLVAPPVSSPVAESDSEEDDDDLHIVLNEDNTNQRNHGAGGGASDGKGVCCGEDACGRDGSGPGGSEWVRDEDGVRAVCGGSPGIPVFKRGRLPYSASFSGNVNAKRVVGSTPYASTSAYWGDKELNWWEKGSAVVAPCCGGFWLPRSRTILDVNIDAVEEKRWRSPGADVSDFFNFGLNEDAWKEYCSSLDQIRQWSYTRRQSSITVHSSSKLPQGCEFGSRQQILPKEDTVKDVILTISTGSSGEKLGSLNAQAIQIEESTFERQPTMDLSQPRMSDPDVIIEIKVQDCDDNCCDIFKESDHLERTKLGLLDGKDVGLSHDKDEKLIGCLELDEESRDRKYFSHSDDSRSGADTCHPHKMKDQISMDGSEAEETVEKTEEEAVVNMQGASQDLVDTDSSISGKIQFSPTVSCSGSETKSSIDGFCNIPDESPCHPRKINVQAYFCESADSDSGSPKSVSAIKESSCVRRYESDENSIQERHKHQTGRVQRRISYNDGSPKSMHRSKSPSRRCKLNKELPASRNRYDWHHTDRVQRRISPYHYDDSPRKSMRRSMSPARPYKLNEELLASSNHCREYFWHQTDEGQRRISPENCNDASPKSTDRSISPAHCSKRKEELPASSNHCRAYFSDRTHRDDYYDHSRQGLAAKHHDDIYANHPQRRLHRRFEDETKLCGSVHLDEEIFDGRGLRLKNQDDRDRYWYNGGRRELACSTRPNGKSDIFIARDIQLNGVYGSQLMKNGDSPLFDHEILDNLGKEKCRGFIRSRHRSDHVAGSLCREMDDGYDRENRNYMTPRSDMCKWQFPSGFSDHRRRIIEENGRKRGRLGVIHGFLKTEDDTVYPDDGGLLTRPKYGHQLDTWSDAHDELGVKWQDDVCYFEKESRCGTKSLRHQKIYASRCSNEELVSNELQFEHPREEKIRGHLSTKCVNMYRNSIYSYDHDHTVRRSSVPVDLFVGKRKTSETYSQGLKFDGKKRRQRGWIQADIRMTRGKKNNKGKSMKRTWLKEDTELNDASDIEEGQIITEDANSIKSNLAASLQQAGKVLPPTPQQGTDSAYDDRRISEAMARMERRRERFKEPLAISM